MWPPQALEFLRDLEANNDRDWFKANRERYDEHLIAPAKALAEQLTHLGEPHYFRPYNDTRFHARPPIKEQVGVAIAAPPAGTLRGGQPVVGGAGGFYFELSLDGLLVAAGMHQPASDQLDRFRAAIDDGRRAKGFARALDKALAAGLELPPPGLKRAPRGYPQDHPRLGLLRLKQLAVYNRHPLRRWLHTRECDKRVRAELESARPLVAWLAENVGPTTRSRT
jgi:uncharacterized protein (TIGR02453 family)